MIHVISIIAFFSCVMLFQPSMRDAWYLTLLIICGAILLACAGFKLGLLLLAVSLIFGMDLRD